MLDRDTDLTSNRLFHNKYKFYNSNKAINKVKSYLIGFYDIIEIDSLTNTSSDKILNFKLKMAKMGIFFNSKDERIIKYHFLNDNKYCDRCGREFNILGLLDKKHYCTQVQSKAYDLCIECDNKLKQERRYGGIIDGLLFGKDNKGNIIFEERIFQMDKAKYNQNNNINNSYDNNINDFKYDGLDLILQ